MNNLKKLRACVRARSSARTAIRARIETVDQAFLLFYRPAVKKESTKIPEGQVSPAAVRCNRTVPRHEMRAGARKPAGGIWSRLHGARLS